jgi:hypothetical protein
MQGAQPANLPQIYSRTTEEILDLIAFRQNADPYPRLSPGSEFFATLRKFTVDGFFTSEIGIKYLGYIGNTYLREFPGCPEIPEARALRMSIHSKIDP